MGRDGGQTQAAILLCCSLWEDVLGKNVHSHLGYPETCSPPQADIKSVDKAWSGLSLTYCCCVMPLGNFFCASLIAILFSPLPLDDMEVAFSAALNSLLRGGGTWPKQGSKDIPVIWLTHQFTLRGSQHTPISRPVISLLFPVLSKTTTTNSISAEAYHIFRVPKSFSYQPNKHRVDCFPDPRDSGGQRQIAVKWLRHGVFYIHSSLVVHPCYSLVKFPAWKS